MFDAHKVRTGKVNVNLVDALDSTMDSVMRSNADLRAAKAVEIQKRGFSYQGDTHNAWGLAGNGFGHGTTGYFGGAPFYGRGPESQIGGFSLQPFGLGMNGVLSGGVSPSIFAGSGAGVKLSKTTHIARLKMAMAVEAYKGFGIVKNVIDLMCNFASEGITVIHQSPAIQRFYQRWFESVDMEGRIKSILRYYYKYGNVFIYTVLGAIDDFVYKQMKSARGSYNSVSIKNRDPDLIDTNDPNEKTRRSKVKKESKKPVSEREIPWRYILLNPFQMERIGSKYFGQSRWVMCLDEETRTEIENKSKSKTVDVLDETDIGLPPEFKKLTKDNNVVKLDQEKLWTLHYMKDDHEDWADPIVWPVMNDIIYKNNLRSMDMSVVNSTINAITIFKIGDIKNGFVAPSKYYEKLSQMLRTPTYSHNIIWNDAISMETAYPPIEKILSIDKYKSVDRDILAGLGIPGILVAGAEGGSFANAFLQVRTLLERLEDGRREVMRWLKKQLRIIAEIMGHRQIPIVKFGSMSLRDEQAEKKLIIQLLDRNIISAERVHETFGIETTIEIERMRREIALSEKEELMVKFGPYKDPMNLMSEEETMELQTENDMKKLKMQQKMQQQRQPQSQVKKQNSKPNGRPPGSNDIKQETKRETKPSGMGLGSVLAIEALKDKALSAYEFVEDYLTALMIQSRGVAYKKSLAKADRNDLEDLIVAVYSNIELDADINNDTIHLLLENPVLDKDFAAMYRSVCDLSDKELSADNRRIFRSMALVLTKGDLNAF